MKRVKAEEKAKEKQEKKEKKEEKEKEKEEKKEEEKEREKKKREEAARQKKEERVRSARERRAMNLFRGWRQSGWPALDELIAMIPGSGIFLPELEAAVRAAVSWPVPSAEVEEMARAVGSVSGLLVKKDQLKIEKEEKKYEKW